MATINLHFCGTECWPTEGMGLGVGGDPRIFAEESGYIPVKLYELSKNDNISFVMPGPGAPWADMYSQLWFPTSLGLTPGSIDTVAGNSMGDIAGHAVACCLGIPSSGRLKDKPTKNDIAQTINMFDPAIRDLRWRLGAELTPMSGKTFAGRCWWSATNIKSLSKRLEFYNVRDPVEVINIIGHSRGGVAAIMASHDIHDLFPNAKINIFAIDPVPGTGSLTRRMVTLSKGVKNYVGIYAIDERSGGFNGIVPRYHNSDQKEVDPLEFGGLANNRRPNDRLLGGGEYKLIYSPGRHATVAGNITIDGKDNPSKVHPRYSEYVALLVFRLAKSYFISWGSKFAESSISRAPTQQIIRDLKTPHAQDHFKKMRESTYNTGSGGGLVYFKERGVTSSSGNNPKDWEYLEEVIGIAVRVGFFGGYRSSKYQQTTTINNQHYEIHRPNKRWESLTEIESTNFTSIPPS